MKRPVFFDFLFFNCLSDCEPSSTLLLLACFLRPALVVGIVVNNRRQMSRFGHKEDRHCQEDCTDHGGINCWVYNKQRDDQLRCSILLHTSSHGWFHMIPKRKMKRLRGR